MDAQPLDFERAELAKTANRWLALDVFRALAVLWMIQGHTFTALLRPALYRGAWVQPYSLLHGLTAPMFLIGAGLSYGVVMLAGVRAGDRSRSQRILRRALQLLAIGTILQLPRATWFEIFTERAMITATIQPGALQLVASGLLVAELARRATRSRLGFVFAVTGLGLATSLGAPWVWNARVSSSLALGAWLDGQTGAQFPLFPWLCFFLVGASLAGGYGRRLWQERGQTRGAMPALGIAGFACSALCYAAFLTGVRLESIYGAHAFWYSSPMFVVFRAGLACAWLGLLTQCEPLLIRALARFPWIAHVLRALAKHSLIAYVVHLMLLYGTPWNAGLTRGGATAGVAETFVAFAGVLCLTVASVLAWDRWQVSGRLRGFVFRQRSRVARLADPGA